MTAEELIEEVRQIAQLPTPDSSASLNPNSEVDTDEGILKIANRELRTRLAAEIMDKREEFFVLRQDFPITKQGAKYRIPSRAIGNKLRDLYLIGADGTETAIPLLQPEEIENAIRDGFYIENNSVVLRSNVSAGTLRMKFFVRPNKIVKATRGAKITAITVPAFTTLNLQSTPTVFGNGTGLTFDLVKGGSPFEHLNIDIAGSVSGGQFTIVPNVADLSTNLGVGDYVFLSDESNFIQVPEDLSPILTYRVALKCVEAIGDEGAVGRISKSLKELESGIGTLIGPRIDGRAKKISNKRLLGG